MGDSSVNDMLSQSIEGTATGSGRLFYARHEGATCHQNKLHGATIMVDDIHVIAGCNCPPVRRLQDILSSSSSSGSYLPTISSLQDMLAQGFASDRDSLSAKVYASALPNFFTRRQEILHQGLFYGAAATAAATLSQAVYRARLSIHFFIEPTMAHLNRHFGSLNSQAREQLERGYVPSGWVHPLLSVKDASGSASVYAWNLQTIENWREDFLGLVSDNKVAVKKVELLRYDPHPESMFQFDRESDQSRFELELDAIDSLPDLILRE